MWILSKMRFSKYDFFWINWGFLPQCDQFSRLFLGQEAVVVKNGSRLCGTGAARSSTPILQNKAYWEFKLQQAGIWSCGLANPGCDLNRNLGTDLNSWCLTHDNVIMFNGDIEHKLEPKIQEGDIIVSIIFGHYHIINHSFLIIRGLPMTMWNSMSTSTGKISIALFTESKAQSTRSFMVRKS